MDWLTLIDTGGSLVLLAAVLFGAWKLAGRLLSMMEAQIEYINSSVQTIAQLRAAIENHEKRASERHAELTGGGAHAKVDG